MDNIERENVRAEKGRKLSSSGFVRKIQPSTTAAQLYKVKSESTEGLFYAVIRKSTGEYICECPDFQRRTIMCKHVYACIFSDTEQLLQKMQAPSTHVNLYYDGE
jgi:uncharacterized Zn finger protein